MKLHVKNERVRASIGSDHAWSVALCDHPKSRSQKWWRVVAEGTAKDTSEAFCKVSEVVAVLCGEIPAHVFRDAETGRRVDSCRRCGADLTIESENSPCVESKAAQEYASLFGIAKETTR